MQMFEYVMRQFNGFFGRVKGKKNLFFCEIGLEVTRVCAYILRNSNGGSHGTQGKNFR
jgi:hypothetical protein